MERFKTSKEVAIELGISKRTVTRRTEILKLGHYGRSLVYDPVALERDNQVVLFDSSRQKLYNGVYFDKVSVNGAIPETKEILKNWLDLLN